MSRPTRSRLSTMSVLARCTTFMRSPKPKAASDTQPKGTPAGMVLVEGAAFHDGSVSPMRHDAVGDFCAPWCRTSLSAHCRPSPRLGLSQLAPGAILDDMRPACDPDRRQSPTGPPL